jgi:hypothetical protein
VEKFTHAVIAIALTQAIVAPTAAAPIDSLVDEIKRNVLINNPADKKLEHVSSHSKWAGSQVEGRSRPGFPLG